MCGKYINLKPYSKVQNRIPFLTNLLWILFSHIALTKNKGGHCEMEYEIS
jgi:hypothetical protein